MRPASCRPNALPQPPPLRIRRHQRRTRRQIRSPPSRSWRRWAQRPPSPRRPPTPYTRRCPRRPLRGQRSLLPWAPPATSHHRPSSQPSANMRMTMWHCWRPCLRTATTVSREDTRPAKTHGSDAPRWRGPLLRHAAPGIAFSTPARVFAANTTDSVTASLFRAGKRAASQAKYRLAR